MSRLMTDEERQRLAQRVYTALLDANDKVWEVIQLTHPDPLEALREASEQMKKALKGYVRLHPHADNRKGE